MIGVIYGLVVLLLVSNLFWLGYFNSYRSTIKKHLDKEGEDDE